MASSTVVACRWDWCRSSFPSIDALDTHVKHEHIWPMKPMRKAEIALMRRMDMQSLHSSPNTDSSIISRGLLAGVSRIQSTTPPPVAPLASTPKTDKHLDNEQFDTFTQLSSPSQTQSPQRLPVSPAFESLIKQNGRSGLSAAVEMFERNHGHRANQRVRLPFQQRSPTHRPLSPCSGSSQEVVEQQLTQEDDAISHPLFPSDLQIDTELTDAELVWPTDDELATEEISNSQQPAPEHNHSSPGSTRGHNFRCGSLNVSLGVNSHSASHSTSSQVSGADSQESHTSSRPLVLQTQAPYSSQATGWSQTQ